MTEASQFPDLPSSGPSPDQDPPLGGHRAAHGSRRGLIILAGAGVVAVAVVIAALFTAGVIGGPSYPHPWCKPLLAQLHATGETEQEFEAAVSQIQQQDHAPVGTMLSDVNSYEIDKQTVQNGSDLSLMGNLASEGVALQSVAADLKVLNRDCAQPTNAYEHDAF